ncbi:MAG: exodeoxyribonuclease VII small subunit [Burkholderiales bacterium]|jgi:exodeoxyribonuclease VII small subunit|nr:exodeoxyribonuclease VII small subunit [Burkholderiales bacterium]
MAKAPKSAPLLSDAPPENYEKAMAELNNLIARMEEETLPLDEALKAYRRGSVLLLFCRQTLKEAEQQVRILENDVLKAFDADAEPPRNRP